MGHQSFATESSFKGGSNVLAKIAAASGCSQVLGLWKQQHRNQQIISQESKQTDQDIVCLNKKPPICGIQTWPWVDIAAEQVTNNCCLSCMSESVAQHRSQLFRHAQTFNSHLSPVLLQYYPMARQQSIRTKPRSVWHSIMRPSWAAQ